MTTDAPQPVGPQSGWAIAAGYCGVLSIFIAPAPLAVIFGLLGLADLKRHPEKLGLGRAISGIVVGALVIAGLLAVMYLHHS